jgi:hypothetical protein
MLFDFAVNGHLEPKETVGFVTVSKISFLGCGGEVHFLSKRIIL